MSIPPAMSTRASPNERASRRRWPRGAGLAVVVSVAAVIGCAALVERWLGVEASLVGRAAALALGGGLLVLWLAATRLHAATFGAANVVTLARGAVTVLLVALLGVDAGAGLRWLVVVLAVIAVALDGVDGALARSRGETSAFGARFDMETDALLILTLAALAWQHGKTGAWILLAGLLRYVFVAASYAWPALGRELPASRRRQAVCVVQIVSLIAVLVPFVVSPVSAAIALAGLAVLVWSFAVDVAWLVRRART
jgi:phosphatidylglycerophosphate synthase